MDAVKAIQLDILKNFMDVCRQLNLPYYAIGGTLLGAVRHHGYIPWDDDIDVAMPRDSYETFLANAQSLLHKDHFLQTFETDPEYRLSYAKIRHNQTAFIEKASKHMNIHHGIYIDIFPLDGYPSTRFEQAIYRLKMDVYNFRLLAEFSGDSSSKAKLAMVLAKLCIPSWRHALHRKEKLLKRYPYRSSEQVGIFCYTSHNIKSINQDIFRQYTLFPFEQLQIPVPDGYDAYLRNLSGDYWQLPPENKRQPHHKCTMIDPERSYTTYR